MTLYQIHSASRYHGERRAASFFLACCELAADDYEFRAKFIPLRLTWNGDRLFDKGGE
jgi:hypothetical protein